MNNPVQKPHYGNWVSTTLLKRMAMLFFVFALTDLSLWALVPGGLVIKALLAFMALLCLVAWLYFLLARRLFSAEGGDIQRKVIDELTSRIQFNGAGEALDIGCGSGALSIRIAKMYPEIRVTGIDYWGNGWSYCQIQCEENARLESVESRISFRQASASALPFPNGSFDLVVSNLTFHEVNDCADKLDVVREALRVVRPGGTFVFQDLFLLQRYYGSTENMLTAVRQTGVQEVYYVDTSKAAFIPKMLKLPFMIGTLGLLHGVK